MPSTVTHRRKLAVNLGDCSSSSVWSCWWTCMYVFCFRNKLPVSLHKHSFSLPFTFFTFSFSTNPFVAQNLINGCTQTRKYHSCINTESIGYVNSTTPSVSSISMSYRNVLIYLLTYCIIFHCWLCSWLYDIDLCRTAGNRVAFLMLFAGLCLVVQT